MASIKFVQTKWFIALMGMVRGDPVGECIDYGATLALGERKLRPELEDETVTWYLDDKPVSDDEAWAAWREWAETQPTNCIRDGIPVPVPRVGEHH